MALNLKEVLIEEISLEGLDGITINALFLRLHERKGFTFKIDDSSKPYIWNCVLGLKDIDFFHLEQPRVELVPYNRFHYIDPETRHYLETDSIPDDIYHVKVIMEDGVLGSCSDYYTRTSVTDEVLTGKPSLQQALDKYGNSLVVVAVQETRVRTLLGPHNDPNVKFKAEVYTILEMIGRSRHNGIASYGKSSLLALKESTKTMYYFLKKLRRLNIVKKQRLVLVKKPSNMKVTCFLYHLDRFYVEVGNRQRQEIINMATYLSNKSECMEEVVKTKTDLKMFDLFKKVSQMTSRCGKRYFDFMDVPYREKFPHAKPREYLLKNHYTERKIRHVRLIMPLNEVLKCLKEPDQESDDDDDDEEEEDNEDVAPVPRLQFHRVLDQPQLYQTMQLINAAGSKGLSLIQLKKLMNSHRLIIRRLIKILLKYGLITSIMEDRGRQKTVMYIAADVVTQNKIHKTVNEKMKQLQTIVMTPLKETIKGSRGIAAKEIPIIKFNNEVPTEEKVSEIIEELDKVTEAKPGVVSEKSLLLRREIMLQKQEESGVKVVVTEIFPEKFVEKRTGKEIKGMKRFGALLTESHVRRANWIMEVVSAIKVVVSFRMLKLLRNREKEMNLTICMDHKSLKRLTNALCEEGKIRLYKTVITMGEKTKEFLYLCDINVTTQDETLLRKLEEAKLLNFSVSKEELKNLNLKMAAREKLGKEQEKACHLPTSAMQTIKSHQEYRMKLMAKMPPMNFDRSAGKKYGLLPKMLRIRAVHKYLQYLCYTTHGNKMKSDGNLGNVSEKIGQLVKDKTTDTFDALNDQTDQEISADDTEHEPVVYVDEMSWKRYLPPIPVHSGYPKGWCLVSDCLLIMPVCFFCQIVNVSYQIDGLMETLNHPKKKFYPVINLPFKLTQQLLHAKKYVQSFLHLCGYMAEMGLLSYGREVLKEKEQTFVYLHHTGSLRDSRNSLPGYNKTTYPDGEPFLLKTFNFNDLNGVEEYWEFLQVVALNSSLGSKSLVQRDLDDEISYQERSIREATRTFMPDTVIDDGVIPGDGRGGAGLDSSLFSHTIKNWMYGSVSNASKYKYLPKKVGQDINLVSKREVVDQFNMNRIMGQDRLLLSENSDKPMALKKVRRENLKDNKGGKGQIRAKTTRVTNTHKIVQQQEGKIAKKRSIKFPQIKHRPVKKKAKEKGDEKDKMIYRERNKLRVGFTKKEDSVILMCWLANLIMNNRTSKVTLVPYITIRNYVHDKCGSVSFDKTSIAVQRRIKFVLKNPQTETNLLMFYREAMQDEFVLKTYVSKEYTATDENLVSDFRTLVDYLLEKFKSLDFKRCTLPENLDILRKNYTLQYIGKLKSKKVFTDAANKADVCRDVLRNILHSAVVLQDKQGRTHEMFKLLSQYPDALLCQVIKELRTDGLLVINKKNYQQEAIAQLHTGMGLRNFKVSQRYLYAFKHRYLSAMFDECASMVTQLCDIYLHGNGIDDMYTLPFAAKSGDCAALFPLLLHNMLDMRVTMPQELVIVDMEGFYNFPWGRGKSSSHNTKGDRVLQDIKGHSKDKTTEDKFEKKGKGVGKDDDKYIDESDDDSDIEMEALNKKGAAEKAETASKKLPSNTNYVSEAETVRKAVEDSTRVQVLSNENTCGNVQESEDVSEPNNCETETDKLEIVKDEVVDVTGETGDDFTILTTKNCNIIIPKADPIPETNIESCMMSAIASRTLISLRRAEDCSFDDIRIFNAQDNFVVNSCVIGIKIKDRTEEDNDENGMVKVEMKSKEDVEDAAVENPEVKATETTDTDKEDTNSQLCLDEKKQQLSPLVLSKEKIKNILKGMQRLVPFSLDVEQVWINMLTGGVTPHQLTMCKEIYHSIDSFGELGLRSYELKKECQDKDVWNQALEILLDQNLSSSISVGDETKFADWSHFHEMKTEVYNGCNVYEWLTATRFLFQNHENKKMFSIWEQTMLEAGRKAHQQALTVLKVGVTCTRYVSLKNARPWVIHAYRNIKGRGLHVDEDTENVVPISQDDGPLISSSGSGNQKTSKSSCFLYEEHHDDKIVLTSEKPSTSKETQDHGAAVSKKIKMASDKNEDNSVKSGKSSGKITGGDVTHSDKGKHLTAIKRKLPGMDGEEMTSEPIETESSDRNSSEIQQSKRVKLDFANKEVDLNLSEESKSAVETRSVEANLDEEDSTKDTTDVESVKICNTENEGQQELNTEETQNPVKDRTARLRKRKKNDNEAEQVNQNEPAGVSTYDKVRLVIQPWRKPEGGLNKDVLKMMLESVMLFLMMNPGCPATELYKRYSPYLQPMVLTNLVDILEDIGCLSKQYMKKQKASLFSKPMLPQIVMEEEEDCTMLILPTDDCVLKMGLFGQEAFPNAKWPETCYPAIVEKRTKAQK